MVRITMRIQKEKEREKDGKSECFNFLITKERWQ